MQTRLTQQLDSIFGHLQTMTERRKAVTAYLDGHNLTMAGEITELFSEYDSSSRDICRLKTGNKLYWAGTMAGYRIGGYCG
jgi:hypothetical protein